MALASLTQRPGPRESAAVGALDGLADASLQSSSGSRQRAAHSIFVTAMDSNPLAADPAVVLAEQSEDFVVGLARADAA